jgi:sugar phosphate isomerase/epimerase
VEMLNNVPSGSLGIHFNPANLILADNYTSQSISQCAALVRSVTIRDAVRDLAQRRGIEVEIGRGSAEFPQILGTLEEQTYRGWFIVDRPPSRQVVSQLADAISFLNAL